MTPPTSAKLRIFFLWMSFFAINGNYLAAQRLLESGSENQVSGIFMPNELGPRSTKPPEPVIWITDNIEDQSVVELAQVFTPAQPTPAIAAPTVAVPTVTAAVGTGTSSAGLLGIEANLRFGLGMSLAESILVFQKDAGSLLDKNVLGISSEPRAPLVSDPILRGRRLGQSGAKGSFWFPARRDLDTALSKIDPRLIENINVFKGPYSALYGPSFSFYDVQLFDAPRYESVRPDEFVHNGMSVLEYETNGAQWHGRQSFWGGTTDWGYRIGYSHRTGNDYKTGDGTKLPSSYKSRELDLAFGGNLTTNSKIDFSYLRLDQTDMEFAGQYFDINGLATNAYQVKFAVEDQPRYDRLELDVWYNETHFDGNNLRPGKRSLLPLDNPFRVEGFTDVDSFSSGYRFAIDWGNAIGQLTAGTDLRYLDQALNELNTILGLELSRPIPPSHSSNPGIFVEFASSDVNGWNFRTGSRLDWVSMNATTQVNGLDMVRALGGELDQHFELGSAFLAVDVTIAPNTTLNAAAAYAMRAPTMTEMYANGPFVAVIPQNVGTSVFGNPLLDPERMGQIDVGISTSQGSWRSGASGFYSWIEDYITYDLLNPISYSFVNTPLATLSGFEFYVERDLSNRLTAFGTTSYVEGRDHSRLETISRRRQVLAPASARSQPLDVVNGVFVPDPNNPGSTAEEESLAAMGPLESVVGLRWHSSEPEPTWAVEFAANIFDAQDRIAFSLSELTTPGFTTLDITGFWRARDNMLVTAGVQNLTDKFYRTAFDTRRFGSTQTITPIFRPGITFYFGTELTY